MRRALTAGPLSTTAALAYYQGGTPLAGAPVNARSYTVVASYAGDANHDAAPDVSAAITIDKADASVVATPAGGTYNGGAYTAAATASGIGGVNLSGQLSFDAPLSETNAGHYVLHWAFVGGANYKDQAGSTSIDIAKADAHVVVNGYTGVYDGRGHGLTGSAAGVSSEDLSGLLHLGGGYTDAGHYDAAWSFDGDGNYNPASGSSTVDIAKADAHVVVNGYSGVYDGQAHGLTGSATGVGGMDLSALLNLGPGQTDAGTYPTAWSFDGSGNYNAASGTAAIAIAKAASTTSVAGGAFTYDGTGHGATGASVTGAGGLSAAPTLTYADAAGNALAGLPTDAGSYTVVASYAGDANHTGSSASAAITIARATPAVTAVGGSYTYDGQAHAGTGSVTGVNGANLGAPALTYSYTDTNGQVVMSSSAPVEPGSYTVTASFAGDANYDPASATATLLIAYDVQSMTDLSKAFNAGRMIPIKLQLTDAAGNNLSSPDITLTALRLELVNADGTRTQVTLQDVGNTNPGDLFRYDAALGAYVFHLSTKGLTAGTYDLVWTAEGDATEHAVSFQLV